MEKNIDYVRLVNRAQLGDRESFDCLTELARERVRTFVYRFTLRDDLAQDIVQETLLEMFKILGELKKTDKFWPWLYKIALNKIRLHHRKERRRRTSPISSTKLNEVYEDNKEVVANVVSQELKQIVLMSMERLKPRYRAVLAMRCYDDMTFSGIADVMGCSEFSARKRFYRAKKALEKQLIRRGVGRGALLTALVVFGKVTAPSKAAAAQISVAAATTKVGVAAGLAAIATSKTTVVSLTTAGVLAVGTMVAVPEIDKSVTDKAAFASDGKQVESLQAASLVKQRNEVGKEYWYFLPSGKNGPLIMRLMNGSTKGGHYYCRRIQNEEGNYEFDLREKTIYIHNYHLWRRDLSVWRLPTDEAKLKAFLSQTEGNKEQMEYLSDDRDNLLVVVSRDEEDNYLWMSRHYNVLSEEYFQHNWPTNAKVVDNRDSMHKRGWTYFRIAGQIDGQQVWGVGRIPFVHATSQQYYPWIRLKVGRKLLIVDNGTEACAYKIGGKQVASYKGGSFFSGLGRPWMGLHTIDTVRRDAAQQQVLFETKYSADSGKAEVILSHEQTSLIYSIDMEKDVIDKITFSGDVEGVLRFDYLREIDNVGNAFREPRSKSYVRPQQKSEGMLWLTRLARGEWISNSN